MKQATFTEIRNHAKHYFDLVESGESVRVLRGMDAIHIGSAVTLQADVFISADKRQCEAAADTGLRVEQV